MKKNKSTNKKALLALIALSIGTAAQGNSDVPFNLREFNSYSPLEVVASCGEGSCGGHTSEEHAQYLESHPEEDHSQHDHSLHDQSDNENTNENDSQTLKECKNKCKEDFSGKEDKADRKNCIKECKEKF